MKNVTPRTRKESKVSPSHPRSGIRCNSDHFLVSHGECTHNDRGSIRAGFHLSILPGCESWIVQPRDDFINRDDRRAFQIGTRMTHVDWVLDFLAGVSEIEYGGPGNH